MVVVVGLHLTLLQIYPQTFLMMAVVLALIRVRLEMVVPLVVGLLLGHQTVPLVLRVALQA